MTENKGMNKSLEEVQEYITYLETENERMNKMLDVHDNDMDVYEATCTDSINAKPDLSRQEKIDAMFDDGEGVVKDLLTALEGISQEDNEYFLNSLLGSEPETMLRMMRRLAEDYMVAVYDRKGE